MREPALVSETWLPVVGYGGYYEVSDLGRVRTLARTALRANGRTIPVRARIKSQFGEKTGYLSVTLGLDGVKRRRRVHVLVLEAFKGGCPEGFQGCHGNGDPADNRLANLRWDTVSSNAKDRTRHGTNHLANRTHCPRQHSLAAPNLVPSTLARGYRDCLACSRARGYGQIAKRYGRPFNFEEAADKYYAAIMKEHHVGVGLRA